MDESAQNVAASHVACRSDGSCTLWGGEIEAAMWSSLVVVRDVLRHDPLQMPPRENEQLIETFFSDRAHPPFRECVVTSRQLQLMMKI